ncbi:MAG: PKD domain-containing protein, partial [Bacteroidota bacterium]
LHLVNNCGEDVKCKDLTVIPQPHALFDLPPSLLDGEGCAGSYEFCNVSDTVNFLNLEYYWGVYFDNDLLGQLDTQQYKNCFVRDFTAPGAYALVLTATNFDCDTVEYHFEFTIIPSAFVTLADPDPFCDSDFMGYTPQVSPSGDITDYCWTFENGTPATSNDPNPTNIDFPPGSHEVTLVIKSACGEQTYQTVVRVDTAVGVSFLPLQDAYCTGQGDTVKIVATPPGGTWNSPLVFNDSCVAIDALPIGDNRFTYTIGAGACSSSEDLTIAVNDTAHIDFEVSSETFCADEGIVSLAGVTPPGGTWSGTGVVDASTGTIDAGLIGAGNTATIWYTFTNAEGCSSQASQTVIIEGLPEATLPQDTLFLCDAPGTVNLGNELDIQLATGFTDEWLGNCIDATGTLDPACLGIGTFELEYIVFTPNGCTDTTHFTIQVDSFQPADAGEDFSACVSNGATITLNGSPAGGTWTGTNVSPDGVITIDEAMEGDYVYTYTFGAINCANADELVINLINLNEVSASLPDYCETEQVVALPDGNPSGGTWLYNGTPLPNNELDIASLGAGSFVLDYAVEAMTSTGERCTNDVPVDLFIDALPAPIITIPTNLCINVPQVIANATTEEYASWQWDLGNGTTATGLNPTLNYNATGNYTITLDIQDTVCQQTFTWEVAVSSPPPPLALELEVLSTDSCELLEVAFINQSQVDPNVTDVIYAWDFGNGMMDTTYSADEAPDNVYFEAFDADTIYTVTLSAVNSCGMVTPAQAEVYVKPIPISQFSTEFETYCSGATINFINASVGNPENTIIDLGDGSPLIYDYPLDTLSHQYFVGERADTFRVQFISTNPCGSDTISFPVEILPVDVVSAFTVEGDGVFCQNSPLCLTDGATPGATVWYDMGDGNTLFSSDTCYAYSQAGNYVITQYARDLCGGLDTLQTPISILAIPEIAISSVNSVCFGDSVAFDLSLSDDVVDISWDFGDGSSSDEASPVHRYSEPGTYTATARALSLQNCLISATTAIVVEELIDVSFAVEDSICAHQPTPLENTSLGANFSCFWLVDGTEAFTTCEAATTFDSAGIHHVSLTITDNTNGCKNTL